MTAAKLPPAIQLSSELIVEIRTLPHFFSHGQGRTNIEEAFLVDIQARLRQHAFVRHILLIAADLLTGFRLFVAFLIVVLGIVYGRSALPWVVVMTMLAWMGDFFDGKAARLASGTSVPRTKLGHYDFVVDATLTLATLIYLTLASLVPPWLAVAYVVIAFLVCAHEEGSKTVVIAFMRPVDLTAGFFAFYFYPPLAFVFLVWLLLALFWNWKRVKVGTPYFFKDIRARITGKSIPEVPSREEWGELHEEWPWDTEENRNRIKQWERKVKSHKK